MERAFLDSHVAYWLAMGSPSLGKHAFRAISNSSTRVISALTIVEFSVNRAFGAIRGVVNLVDEFGSAGISVESFDVWAAQNLGRFSSLERHDPFDRMILSQAAVVPGTTLFTADEVLLDLGFDWVVDARA